MLALGGTCLALLVLPMAQPTAGKISGLDGLRPPMLLPDELRPHPNVLAYLLLPAPLALLALAPASQPGLARLGILASALVGFLVIVTTGSRSAFLGALAGIVCLLVLAVPLTPLIRAAAAATALALGVTLLMVGDPPEFGSRVAIWATSLAFIADSPNLVVGFGSVAYAVGPTGVAIANAHDALVQTLGDFGPIGTGAITAAFVGGFIRTALLLRSEASSEVALGRACAAIIVGLAVTGVAESVLTTAVVLRGQLLTVLQPIPFVMLALVEGRREWRVRRQCDLADG